MVDPSLYLYAHRTPCCRFFAIQDWAIDNGPSLREKVRTCFQEGQAQWILICGQNSNIEDILAAHYHCVEADKVLQLRLMRHN